MFTHSVMYIAVSVTMYAISVTFFTVSVTSIVVSVTILTPFLTNGTHSIMFVTVLVAVYAFGKNKLGLLLQTAEPFIYFLTKRVVATTCFIKKIDKHETYRLVKITPCCEFNNV